MHLTLYLRLSLSRVCSRSCRPIILFARACAREVPSLQSRHRGPSASGAKRTGAGIADRPAGTSRCRLPILREPSGPAHCHSSERDTHVHPASYAVLGAVGP